MRRQEDLQIKLRERYRRLLVSDHDAYDSTLRVVRDFIAGDPLLQSLLIEASRVEPELDVEAWLAALGEGGGWSRGMGWTHTTEAGQATLVWALVNGLVDDTIRIRSMWMITGERNFNDAARRFTEMALEPLFNFLGEAVGEQSSVLHALQRYVRVVEWFDRDALLRAYEADTQRGEAVYDQHLRRFLFSEGIDMPFSQARSPSGDSDAVSQLESENPLVCEVKLFDADGRGKRHLVAGIHQVLQYAEDYGKPEAHLVIVNVSGRPLELPSDGSDKQWPPYLDIAGVRVYLIVVRAKRAASASKLGKARPVQITREEAVDPDVGGE